ncbi:uncharacterized protein B0H18DRAFT_1120196 [Fomitopsis serialis]|uniref:uncharacterized protein n=1 Tax=Fomitopsis serialis TaxID=139415 RepID=UPI002007F23A|nr:uncharacterized protein B0H18DRAFT_1120196 [Neoantrodia serialis]KAH9923843.1 hypothetical protein B0H18DRAFT_1120196 [Neoantrodia serialis]
MSSPSESDFSRTVRSPLSQPLTTASSSATLVEHFRVGMSSATPADIPPVPRVTQTTDSDPTAWTRRLSSSFGNIAEQISAASQALAAVEVPASIPANGDVASALAHLTARLDAIEDTQVRIGQEIAGVRRSSVTRSAKENSLARTVEELQKKVGELAEIIRLDALVQPPAECHYHEPEDARQAIGHGERKDTPNFPGTKGEFEHMTKERYEHLLKSYNLPIKGDTVAKCEAVREFLGLSQPNK